MLKLLLLPFSSYLLLTNCLYAQSCPPTFPTAPTCTATCGGTAANNDNLNAGTVRCYSSGTSTFGTYGLNGGTLLMSGGDLTINNFDISNAASTVIVTGGTLNISWRNLNTIGNLRVCGGTVNIVGGTNYNNGFNYNVASGGTLNFSTTFNASGNMTITNRGNVNFNATGDYNFNNSGNSINNLGTMTGTNADWNLASSSSVVNNAGNISIRNLAMNTGNFVNMANGASLTVTGNLESNNQTNSFCVEAGGCANLTVNGSSQMNNPLTGSSGIRYCGAAPTGSGGLGSAVNNCVTCPSVLPLTWLSFGGKVVSNNSILLNWATTQEINTQAFEIEHSYNGTDFTLIGNVKSNNTLGKHTYTFTDKNIVNPHNYYRIKQIDVDVQHTYSKTILVNYELEATNDIIERVYPNPVSNYLTITLTRNSSEKFLMTLYTVYGQAVWQTTLTSTVGEINTALPQLPQGMYIVQLASENSQNRTTIIVE